MLRHAFFVAAALAVVTPAVAADYNPVPIPGDYFYYDLPEVQPLPRDWTGPYIGIAAGYSFGETEFQFDEDPLVPFSGYDIGVFAGYNWQVGDRVVVGIEADAWWSNQAGLTETWWEEWCNTYLQQDATSMIWTASLTGRVGVLLGEERRTMLYAKAGVAVGQWDASTTITGFDKWGNSWQEYATSGTFTGIGPTVGVGVEIKLASDESTRPSPRLRAEYTATWLESILASTPGSSSVVDHRVSVGIVIPF